MSSQNKILKKTIEVGGSTLLSKLFGILRELLMVRYLGATGLSDVFIIAFRIPNSLRKIFAEGALSAAFTPTAINIIKHEGKEAVAGLVSLSFLIFEGIVLLLCIFIMYYAAQIIQFLVPGFSAQQIAKAIPMVHILMPYIFFISSSALLGGALHAVGHFFIPAIAPFVMNIIFIAGIGACLFFNLPVTTLCWFILFSGVIHFAMHVIIYFKFQFSFGTITRKNISVFVRIMGKFLLCLPSISLMELALYVDTNLGSYLPKGSISLFYYANRFVGIPLGVFAVAFSTILLPHFSRVNTYSPKRLHFYLLESTKFILWGTAPIMLLMAFFSEEIFSTLFLSEKFTALQAHEAGNILLAFLIGLFFFSINKLLLNIFYAMHAAWIPAIVALITTTLNVILNRLLIGHFQTVGLALATSIASIVQTIAFLIILHKLYNFKMYPMPFLSFITRYTLQLMLLSSTFLLCYHGMIKTITLLLPTKLSLFFITKIGLWLWVGPLAFAFLVLLYFSRSLFNINLHFLK